MQLADDLHKSNSEMTKSLSIVRSTIDIHTERLDHWKEFSVSHPEPAKKLLIKLNHNIELCQNSIDTFIDLTNRYSFTSFIEFRFLSMLDQLKLSLYLIRFDLDHYKLIDNDKLMLKVFYLKFKTEKALKLASDIERAIGDAYLTSTCICDSLMYGIVPFRLRMLKRQLRLAFENRAKQL